MLGVAASVAVYAAIVVALVIAGRRADARALATFVPDCVVLCKRLLADGRVSKWRKAVVALVLAYLLSPIDLIPDFVPVAGQLDDAIVVAVALRMLLRGCGVALLREHWSGPDRSLELVTTLAYGR